MSEPQSTDLYGFAYLDSSGNRVEIISTSREDGDRQIREHAIRLSQRDCAASVCVSGETGGQPSPQRSK